MMQMTEDEKNIYAAAEQFISAFKKHPMPKNEIKKILWYIRETIMYD
jgi:DNA replication initiation complex subunit (GINS family)